jgi:hypothetical protein
MFYDENPFNGPVPNITENNCDQRMARLMNILKSEEQSALDRQTNLLEEIKDIADGTGRDDIAECLKECTERIKHDENEHWEIAARWGNHFEDLLAGVESEDEEKPDEDDGEED